MFIETIFRFSILLNTMGHSQIVLGIMTVFSICCESVFHDVGTVIGIDLGTTYSCVAVYRNERLEVIPNELGNRLTPSTVAFTPDGRRLVGDAAEFQRASYPEGTISHVKRLIGRRWEDDQNSMKHFPFEVTGKDNKPIIKVQTGPKMKTFSPEQISAMVLSYLKRMAETYLGENVTHAVVTVPAGFTDAQRQATKDAGMIAGLTILRLINEPTAAAMAYGLYQKSDDRTVVVFDFGGGTLDVSLLAIGAGVTEVLATSGENRLGGEDLTQRIVDHCVKIFKEKHRIDISQYSKALQKLRRESERAKRELSFAFSAQIKIESLARGLDFSHTISRAQFENLNKDLFQAAINPVERVLESSQMIASDISEIILVGGSSKIPKIQEIIRKFFGGKEPRHSVSPDEAVAQGAAIQAGLLGGHGGSDSLNQILIDITPRTLGMNTSTGEMRRLIPRHTVIPVIKSKTFSTAKDNQPNVHIEVCEGEHKIAKDNTLLGDFVLDGIPPMPKGTPNIEVTFEVDVNGILQVTANDRLMDNSITVTIQRGGGQSLSFKDLDRMIEESERYDTEENSRRDLESAKEELEALVYQMNTRLNGDIEFHENGHHILDIIKRQMTWLDDNQDASIEDYVKAKAQFLRLIQRLDAGSILSGQSDVSVSGKQEL